MAKCQICGKKSVVGRNASHAENKTARVFGANIQKNSFYLKGKKTIMTLCTKCIKRLKQEETVTKQKKETKKEKK